MESEQNVERTETLAEDSELASELQPVPSATTTLSRPMVLAMQLSKDAHAIEKVRNRDEYIEVGARLRTLQTDMVDYQRRWKADELPHTVALQRVRREYQSGARALEEAKRHLRNLLESYDAEQRRIAAAAQARADAKAAQEAARLLKRAEKAVAKGDAEKAAQLAEEASFVTAPVINAEPPKVEGVYYVEKWLFEITDPDAVPQSYMTIDEARIRKTVNALKGAASIPGVRIWMERRAVAKGETAGGLLND